MAIFITFEGIDGCGKTTQCHLLSDFFKKAGKPHISIREPGATKIGEQIRSIIQDPETIMDSHTEAYLYAACRSELVESTIKPALKLGKIVLCDRFLDSSLAYQGYARGMGVQIVNSINQIATKDATPDITFFIDTPVEIAQSRLDKNNLDRIEQEGSIFQEKVQQGYKEIAKENHRIIIIDGSQSTDQIHQQILLYVIKHIEGS